MSNFIKNVLPNSLVAFERAVDNESYSDMIELVNLNKERVQQEEQTLLFITETLPQALTLIENMVNDKIPFAYIEVVIINLGKQVFNLVGPNDYQSN